MSLSENAYCVYKTTKTGTFDNRNVKKSLIIGMSGEDLHCLQFKYLYLFYTGCKRTGESPIMERVERSAFYDNFMDQARTINSNSYTILAQINKEFAGN